MYQASNNFIGDEEADRQTFLRESGQQQQQNHETQTETDDRRQNETNGAQLWASFTPLPLQKISATRDFAQKLLAQLEIYKKWVSDELRRKLEATQADIELDLQVFQDDCRMYGDRWFIRSRILEKLEAAGETRNARRLEARIGQARQASRNFLKKATPQAKREKAKKTNAYLEVLAEAAGDNSEEPWENYLENEMAHNGERRRGKVDTTYSDEVVDEMAPEFWEELFDDTRSGFETTLARAKEAQEAARENARRKGTTEHKKFQQNLVQLLKLDGPRLATVWEQVGGGAELVTGGGGAIAHAVLAEAAAAAC